MSNEENPTLADHVSNTLADLQFVRQMRTDLNAARAENAKLVEKNRALQTEVDGYRTASAAAVAATLPHCEPGNPTEDHPAHATDVDVEAPPWPRGDSFDLPK